MHSEGNHLNFIKYYIENFIGKFFNHKVVKIQISLYLKPQSNDLINYLLDLMIIIQCKKLILYLL